MRCPDCGGRSTVIDTKDPTRDYAPGSRRKLSARKRAKNAVYRRRMCLGCGARWSTVERVKEMPAQFAFKD